jgi:hypothetical protein
LIVAASSPAPASAQDSTVRRDSAVAKLNTGQRIRISAEGMQRLVGKAGVSLNDTLDFAQRDAVRRIPIPAIDSLWVLGGNWKSGAIIGGALVGALTAITYFGLASYCDTTDCGATVPGAIGSVLLGATIGVTIGAMVGRSVQTWKQAFP